MWSKIKNIIKQWFCRHKNTQICHTGFRTYKGRRSRTDNRFKRYTVLETEICLDCGKIVRRHTYKNVKKHELKYYDLIEA